MMKIDPAIVAELEAFRNEVGDGAEIDAVFIVGWCFNGNTFHCTLTVDRRVSCGDQVRFSRAHENIADFIPEARAWWNERKSKLNAEKIRRMALAVIEVTADKGECLPADLRARSFSDAEIKSFGTLACEEAQRLADAGPFSISDGNTGNGAPIEGEEAA